MSNISQIKNKRALGAKLKLILFAACVLVALVVYICFKAVKNPPFLPSLFSFSVFFLLFGIAYFILTVINKEVYGYFLAIISVALGLLFVLIIAHIRWYVILAIVLAFLVIAVALCLAFATKGMVIVAKNETSDYKNYKQRRAEKEDQEKKDAQVEQAPSANNQENPTEDGENV